MTKETLIKILSKKSMSFSEKEINEMLDAELEKAPEEMDTDFVNLCLDVLDGKYGEGYYAEDDNSNNQKGKHSRTKNRKKNDEANNKKRKIKFGKILLIAALIAAVLACSITAGAKFVHINASDDTVSYDGDHFSIDLNSNEDVSTVDDIVQTLVIDGVKNVVLPSVLLNGDYVIGNYNIADNNINFSFNANNSETYATVNISSYSGNYSFSAGQADASDEFYSAEEIKANGFTILKFKSDDLITLIYIAYDNEYTITLHNCDSKQADKISKTIGEQK